MKKQKFILVISVIFFSSLLSAGCMMMGGGMGGGGGSMDMGGDDMDMGGSSASMDMGEKGMDMSSGSKSYVIAKRYCSQCHKMKEKRLYDSNQWKPILNRMMEYMDNQAKLKPDSYEKVMIEHYYGVDE